MYCTVHYYGTFLIVFWKYQRIENIFTYFLKLQQVQDEEIINRLQPHQCRAPGHALSGQHPEQGWQQGPEHPPGQDSPQAGGHPPDHRKHRPKYSNIRFLTIICGVDSISRYESKK